MPAVRCPHCGAETFTVTGWADLDRCGKCGGSLAPAQRFPREATIGLLPSRRGEMRYAITRREGKEPV